MKAIMGIIPLRASQTASIEPPLAKNCNKSYRIELDQFREQNKGKFFSKVKLSLVTSTTFEFSRKKTGCQNWHISKEARSKMMDFQQFEIGKALHLGKVYKLKCQF